MPRKTISEPVWVEARNRWKVDLPASLAEDGKRTRAFFKTREKARDYVNRLTNDESEATAFISPSLAMEADKARSILQPCDLDLVQAARTVKNALAILEGTSTTIEAACRFFAESHAKTTASLPFKDAVARYLDARGDLRNATLASYRYTLERAFAPFADCLLAEVTTGELEGVLHSKSSTASEMHRRNLGAFWRWASKAPRRWADLETYKAIEARRRANDTDITLLRPADVKALLRAAETEGRAAAASFAIAVFAGVRMAELERLQWRNVSEDHIEIGPSIAKRQSRRSIPISPTLQAWLAHCREESTDDQSIVPANWREISKSVRRRAGWDVVARLLKNPPKPTRGPWPANAPRHTCASVLVALGTPLEMLVFQFGHSGGHDLLRKHYVARLTRKDALAILQVAPKGVKIPRLAVA